MIIDAINKIGYGFKIDHLKLSSLFYMDDALIFTENYHETERILNRLSFICMKYGLELNKRKCKILTFNEKTPLHQFCDEEISERIG